MSYLFCGPVIFPPRPRRRLTQGPAATGRRKEWRERILFNFFFSCFTHFSVCLPQASSPPLLGCLPRCLLALLLPFLQQDRSNWRSGGSYRECIGSLGEKSPQQAIHQMYNVIWSNWQTQKRKNKRRELGRGIQRRVFKTARRRAWIPLLRLTAWKKRC